MAILSDKWIRDKAQTQGMIELFVEAQRRDGCISYGLGSPSIDGNALISTVSLSLNALVTGIDRGRGRCVRYCFALNGSPVTQPAVVGLDCISHLHRRS